MSLDLIAVRLPLSFSGLVRSSGDCSQVCPLASFQWPICQTLPGPARAQHHFLQRHILQPAQGTTTAASYRCKPGAIRATTVVAYPVEGRCHKVVWLAFGTFCTDLVHHLSASCGDLVRIKPCSLIAFIAKLQHCRVLAVCQAWLLVPDLLGT